MKPQQAQQQQQAQQNAIDVSKLKLDKLFDRLQKMANESAEFLELNQHRWDEELGKFGITPANKYYLVCYYLTDIYANYVVLSKKLFDMNCQIDFTDDYFMIQDVQTGELITNPEVYIDDKHNAHVYCKKDMVNNLNLRSMVLQLALLESVLRMALSYQYWKVDKNVLELVDSMCYEWLNRKFDYMDNKPFKPNKDNVEWVNLTKIILEKDSETMFTINEGELVIKK